MCRQINTSNKKSSGFRKHRITSDRQHWSWGAAVLHISFSCNPEDLIAITFFSDLASSCSRSYIIINHKSLVSILKNIEKYRDVFLIHQMHIQNPLKVPEVIAACSFFGGCFTRLHKSVLCITGIEISEACLIRVRAEIYRTATLQDQHCPSLANKTHSSVSNIFIQSKISL